MSQDWGTLALHEAEKRIWTRVGDGLELSIVGRDPATGATAMFQRVARTETPGLEARPHSHLVACQTIVLSGEVQIALESETRTMKEGDYLRVPADTPHQQTVLSDSAEMFVMTQGDPGIEFVVPERWSPQVG
jgi:quercetin dioxygenase-like cupin family protein